MRGILDGFAGAKAANWVGREPAVSPEERNQRKEIVEVVGREQTSCTKGKSK